MTDFNTYDALAMALWLTIAVSLAILDALAEFEVFG